MADISKMLAVVQAKLSKLEYKIEELQMGQGNIISRELGAISTILGPPGVKWGLSLDGNDGGSATSFKCGHAAETQALCRKLTIL